MRLPAIVVVFVVVTGALPAGQERKVPSDSVRVSIPGCAKNRTFIVGQTPSHEPIRSEVAPGRRFRLSGPKPLLAQIKQQQGTMVEVTGLVRKGQLAGPGGVKIGGVHIGGGPPQAPTTSSPRTDSGYMEAVIDVESWRPLAEPCPTR